MQHEKVIVRPDGTEVIIQIELYNYQYITRLASRAAGSSGLVQDACAATPAEILLAKRELWERLEP